VKGTVRPDWICMRVVLFDRPWKGHQLEAFHILFSVLNIWKDFKDLSRFIQKRIQPPACSDHGLYKILFSYWLAHICLLKKSAKVMLYFALDCGMLKYSTHEPQSKEQLSTFRHFWARFGGKGCSLSPYKPWSEQAGVWINFEWSGSELRSFLKNS
jgi:hypothetical protein